MELQTRARQELDRIAVKYHDMSIEQLIELTEHMHHLATKLHMFQSVKEPAKDKDPTNN